VDTKVFLLLMELQALDMEPQALNMEPQLEEEVVEESDLDKLNELNESLNSTCLEDTLGDLQEDILDLQEDTTKRVLH